LVGNAGTVPPLACNSGNPHGYADARAVSDLPEVATALARQPAGEFVYVICEPARLRFKIGRAGKPKDRLRKLRTACSDDLLLIATLPGGRELESELHRALEATRIRGEWFEDSPLLQDVIAAARERQLGFSVREAIELREIELASPRMLSPEELRKRDGRLARLRERAEVAAWLDEWDARKARRRRRRAAA
jgi:hypothetical protein